MRRATELLCCADQAADSEPGTPASAAPGTPAAPGMPASAAQGTLAGPADRRLLQLQPPPGHSWRFVLSTSLRLYPSHQKNESLFAQKVRQLPSLPRSVLLQAPAPRAGQGGPNVVPLLLRQNLWGCIGAPHWGRVSVCSLHGLVPPTGGMCSPQWFSHSNGHRSHPEGFLTQTPAALCCRRPGEGPAIAFPTCSRVTLTLLV